MLINPQFLNTWPTDETYIERVLGIQSANLLAYWPMNETAGVVADNIQGVVARDAAYSGVTLNSITGPDGVTPAGLWDGVNDFCNIHSASFSAAFDGREGSAIIWFRFLNAAIWTDGSAHEMLRLRINGNNEIVFLKPADNNRIRISYEAAGDLDIANNDTIGGNTDWNAFGLTWSDGADEAIAYLNGVSFTTLTPIGQFVIGALNALRTVIGITNVGGGDPWSGYLAHCAIWDTPLTPAEMLELATV